MQRMLIAFLRSNWPTAVTSAGSIVFMFFLAAGFGFITPKQKFDALQEQVTAIRDTTVPVLDAKTIALIEHIDTKHQAEIDSLSHRLSTGNVLLLALARGQCIDRPSRDLKLMGLDCNKLLRQIGNPDN